MARSDGMKNRFTEEGLRARPFAVETWLALLVGLGFAVATLAAPWAGAQEPERVAQAGDPEPGEAASEPPAEPEPAAEPERDAKSGIEEIVVRGAESEATSDFEAADSVTGFGAEDLAALGAQDISDLASFTPNLEIVTSGATTPTFFIRGVGLNDFNANATGAVAIYRDDVPINAPALQLSTLFDVEAVNVLRGPQGTGLARNASAGAIKIYSRKPTGELGGFLRSELGNFNFRDFEGAIEAPFFEDLVAGRFAFRFSERDGTMKNRCGGAKPFELRDKVPRTFNPNPDDPGLIQQDKKNTDPPWSICGEPVGFNQVVPGTPVRGVSDIPVGLASRVNDIGNWAARGTLLFQPTLDMSWLLNAHGSRRDELSRLGQSYGTDGFFCLNGDIENCYSPGTILFPDVDPVTGEVGSRILGLLGGTQGTGIGGYQAPEVEERLEELAPCFAGRGTCFLPPDTRELGNAAKIQVANELAQGLDSKPWAGDFNRTGSTTNDTWGVYVKGDIVLPSGMQLNSITGYDTYDRVIDIDLDFSPQTLFQIVTDDEGWQVAQDLRLQGQLGDESLLRWDIGGWFLREHLDVAVKNDLGDNTAFAAGGRNYTQDVWSAAGYASLAFDFWDDFTLDGGVRYNWEQKKLDYALTQGSITEPFLRKLDDTWTAPTGLVRLTYRFREDTHVFWKYTRGWKPGTYNATSALLENIFTGEVFPNITVARPETIDAFETGVRGSWLEGRLGLDFSLFYYSYSDYQIFTAQQFAGGQPEFVILNAENAEVYGAEIDAVGRPWSGAYVNVRFGWLESQFLDFVQLQQEIIAPQGVQLTVNRELQNTGNNLLNSPRFKVSLTAEQMVPLGRWGSVTARYDGVWTDTTFYDATEGRGIPNVQNVEFLPEDTIAQPAFWLHNLRLSYRPPGVPIEIAAWVRNLTNEAYKTFGFDGSTFTNTSIYFVGEPRTYGATLTVNF
jgi:outer membrane receptor protein involved in Fe transport